MALTPRQKEVLDFILRFSEKNGYSPSFEEIAGGVDLASLATVHKHISALEQKGYVRRRFNESRSIEVAPEYKQAELSRVMGSAVRSGEIPLMGRIAAGVPVEAIENVETLNFSDFAGSSATFALEVRGDSMIDDHILSGDYVLVQKTEQVRDGEIAVALVDGMETTLKRVYREAGGGFRLQPANAEMQPIRVRAEQLQIQGRVLAVLRKYK